MSAEMTTAPEMITEGTQPTEEPPKQEESQNDVAFVKCGNETCSEMIPVKSIPRNFYWKHNPKVLRCKKCLKAENAEKPKTTDKKDKKPKQKDKEDKKDKKDKKQMTEVSAEVSASTAPLQAPLQAPPVLTIDMVGLEAYETGIEPSLVKKLLARLRERTSPTGK
jgi:hypothetical protein